MVRVAMQHSEEKWNILITVSPLPPSKLSLVVDIRLSLLPSTGSSDSAL